MRRVPETAASRPALALALAALAFALYLPALRYGFVFDDVIYLVTNPDVKSGLTREAARWALTTLHGGHWHPLTWFSHLLDVRLFGLRPAGHHLVNLIWNAANVALVFLVLDALTGRRARSAAVAAIFAVHPLHVENVAWVADRKDLLAAFFCLCAIGFHVRWARRGGRRNYLAVLVLFTLGMLAKTMAVTLPAMLLILDAWPLGRWPGAGRAKLLVEKLPFILLAIPISLRTQVAAETSAEGLTPWPWPLAVQGANAALSYVGYLAKFLWPRNLAVLYPYHTHPSWPRAALALGLVEILLAVAFRLRREAPYLVAGGLWFLVGLTPVIGLVPGGPMAMGDRYMYLPILGLLIAAVWGGADLAAKAGARAVAPCLLLGAVLLALATATERVLPHWKSDETLFGRALQVNPENPLTEFNMGVLAERAGRLDEGMALYRQALSVDPNFSGAHHNLGAALARRGDLTAAVAEYREALRVRPNFPETLYDLGNALTRQGKLGDAIAAYRAALKEDPKMCLAHNNLGIALEKVGREEEAGAEFREALRLDPTFQLARDNLDRALAARVAPPAPATQLQH